MNESPHTSASNPVSPSLGNLYRTLVALRSHHDRMLWSRVQTLIVVQGAVIGGSYAIGDHRLAGGFLFGGAILSIIIYQLVVKDQMDRDANDPAIEKIGELLLPADLAAELRRKLGDKAAIRMSAAPPKWRPFQRGKYLIRIVLLTFVAFDLVLGALHFLGRAPVRPPGG